MVFSNPNRDIGGLTEAPQIKTGSPSLGYSMEGGAPWEQVRCACPLGSPGPGKGMLTFLPRLPDRASVCNSWHCQPSIALNAKFTGGQSWLVHAACGTQELGASGFRLRTPAVKQSCQASCTPPPSLAPSPLLPHLLPVPVGNHSGFLVAHHDHSRRFPISPCFAKGGQGSCQQG